jgi:protease-4
MIRRIGSVRRIALLALASLAVGCGTPSLLVTPVTRSDKLEETQVQPGKGSTKVAIIPVDGMLMNARTPGLLASGDNPIAELTQQLQRAADDSTVKAIVLRINSPGGTVTASDTAYELIRRFRERTGKPVVASIQEVGASGGYYVACAADRIVAGRTSVVGSIGVIFTAFSFERTLGLVGVKAEAIKSGPLKDVGSPLHDMTPAERALLQATVDEYFARFKSIVLERRRLTDDAAIATATDGRVFSGEAARALGLVDRTGLLEDAIDLARELGNAKGGRAVIYRKPFGPSGSIYASAAPAEPRANATFALPEAVSMPSGFYYLWRP